MTAPPAALMGVDDAVAQAFRSAAHAFQVQAAALFRAGRLVAFASPTNALTMEQVAPAVAASTDVATRGPLTRFYTPPGSDTDFVLYATPVRGDLALAAFFTMDTPLGNARRSGQALVQAIVRAGVTAAPPPPAESPPTEAPPPLPRDWIPEQPTPELERTLLPREQTPLPTPLPRDWLPTAPASEERLPFLRPPAAAPSLAAPDVAAPTPFAAAGAPLRLSLVLIPRFPEHRLTGALVPRLRAWTQRLCLAWDWRAETIDVRPDRLAIVLTIGPETAPALVAQQLRDGLASRVLQTFPQLAADLPSGRFWASPSLLAGGALPDETEVRAFIRDTRRAQGFSPRA